MNYDEWEQLYFASTTKDSTSSTAEHGWNAAINEAINIVREVLRDDKYTLSYEDCSEIQRLLHNTRSRK